MIPKCETCGQSLFVHFHRGGHLFCDMNCADTYSVTHDRETGATQLELRLKEQHAESTNYPVQVAMG